MFSKYSPVALFLCLHQTIGLAVDSALHSRQYVDPDNTCFPPTPYKSVSVQGGENDACTRLGWLNQTAQTVVNVNLTLSNIVPAGVAGSYLAPQDAVSPLEPTRKQILEDPPDKVDYRYQSANLAFTLHLCNSSLPGQKERISTAIYGLGDLIVKAWQGKAFRQGWGYFSAKSANDTGLAVFTYGFATQDSLPRQYSCGDGNVPVIPPT